MIVAVAADPDLLTNLVMVMIVAFNDDLAAIAAVMILMRGRGCRQRAGCQHRRQGHNRKSAFHYS
jgi:hypothetical protein